MLEAIAKTQYDLIFLGDIFELWIALARYEEDIHIEFTAWCMEQKNYRTIGFLEGNHEYYLTSQRAYAFTWCSNDTWRQDESGTLFVHGDQINRRDIRYLTFRNLIKNSISKFMLWGLPFGPKIAESVERGLKKTNTNFRIQIPQDEIKCFADTRFAAGVSTIFVGHFHQEYCYCKEESKKLYVLPDWLGTQKITLFQKYRKTISIMHWRELS
jgi:UDP-2,3-diacylglucosamine pyrophosphatase LpxH